MAKKKKALKGAVERFNVNLPAATLEWFRTKAEEEGVTIQSLIAPVLNAVARGKIVGRFLLSPEPHGNANMSA